MQLEPSWRQPFGIFVIFAWIAGWSALAVTAAELISGAPWPVTALYFLAAGIVWVLPLGPLLKWMSRRK